MNKPKYGAKYVCDDFPDTILGWDETVSNQKNLYFFIKYTPDMKRYTGTVWIRPEYFDERFKEVL